MPYADRGTEASERGLTSMCRAQPLNGPTCNRSDRVGWWEKKLELLRACVVEASAASLVMLVTKLGTCERRRDNGGAEGILTYVPVRLR